MSDNWPDNDHLLAYVKESREHERAWKIIAGLSKKLLEARDADSFVRKVYGPQRQLSPGRTSAPLVGPKPENWNDRIQTLETRIVKQKAVIAQLEDCRTFERDTERMLVVALQQISENPTALSQKFAQDVLAEYQSRMGPRPS